jgi:hypothetical protein
MPLIKLKFNPGFNRDITNYSGEGNWWRGDKVRFHRGFPEKIGGWVKATPNVFFGVCRQLWAWTSTFSDTFLSLGTHNKLYIELAGVFNDITPLRASNPTMTTTNTDNCIFTTDTSTTVTVNVAIAHAAEDQSFVTISGVTGNIGGIPDSEINANHKITLIDADSFSFTVTTAATSTVSGGGGTAITIAFEITPGNASTVEGLGWGTGTWSREAWGLGSNVPVLLPQRDWWLNNFDNDLIAHIRNGVIYYWVRGGTSDPTGALATRAVTLASRATIDGFDPNAVPAKAGQVLVSAQDKHLLAFGAVPFGSVDPADFDPLLIRWADQDTPTQWTPAVTNSAGFLRISKGSEIVTAIPTRQETLVWTNTSLYALQFLGTTDVFGLQEYETNISIISPRAVACVSSNCYWMGRGKFYIYSGRVDTLPCTLRHDVFDDFNYEQADQVISGTNEQWNEVWWFYCSKTSNWNNRYVIFNHLEEVWYSGTIERTAWLDTNLKIFPLAATTAQGAEFGTLYQHEDGTDDDTSALSAYVESNDFDVGDGDQLMLTRRIIPDVTFTGSTVASPALTMEIKPRNFPGGAYQTDAANTQTVTESVVDQYTKQIFIRARARQMALKLSSSALGVRWHMGSPRIDARVDGKR